MRGLGWWLCVVVLLLTPAVGAQEAAPEAGAPEAPAGDLAAPLASAPVDPLKQTIKAVRQLQDLEVDDPDAYGAQAPGVLQEALPILQQAASDATDPQRQLTAQLYLIDVFRALGRQAEEQAALEHYFTLALPPAVPENREPNTENRALAAWSAITTFAQHRLFRGLRVVTRPDRWGTPKDELFDEEVVRQAAQAYERLEAWAGQTDLAGKALDQSAWVYYACLNDYDRAMPLCERIAQQWPRSEYHLRAEWRLGMMQYTMGPRRSPRLGMKASTPEDFLEARRHFEVVVGLGPKSPEGQFARRAIEGLVVIGAVGRDEVPLYTEPDPALPQEVREQVRRILAAAREGLAADDKVSPVLQDEFIARFGRWLETALKQPLPAEELSVVEADLRWAPAGPGATLSQAPRFYEWVIASAYAAQRAMARFIASQEWGGPVATRQDRRPRQAEEARILLEAYFDGAWPEAPADVREGCMRVLHGHLDLCAAHPLWGELPLPLPGDAFSRVLVGFRERFAPGVGLAAPTPGQISPGGYEAWLLPVIREALAEETGVAARVESPEETELQQMAAVREAARRGRVRRVAEGGENRLVFDDSPIGRRALVGRDCALFLLRPLWLQATGAVLPGQPMPDSVAAPDVAQTAGPPLVTGWAEVTLNWSPIPLENPWATVDASEVLGVPCSVVARYEGRDKANLALESPSGVVWNRSNWTNCPIRRRLRLAQGRLLIDGARPGVEPEWLAQEWPELHKPRPEGGRYGLLAFYLTRLWLAGRDAQWVPEGAVRVEANGTRVQTYRVTFGTPVEVRAGTKLASVVVDADEARGAPVRYSGYTPDGGLAVEATCSDFQEVVPGRWAALRIEEHWHPGSLTTVIHATEFPPDEGPPREHDRTLETPVPAATDIMEFAVIPGQLVVLKEITRYDDQQRLLMHMRFLNYEIEYDDGTVVYAEPE